MELIAAPLLLIFIVTIWAAQEDKFGPHTAEVLIKVELLVFAVVFVVAFISVNGPYTFIGRWYRKRQERIAEQRAVARMRKQHNNPHH